jgi:hypothetical protein
VKNRGVPLVNFDAADQVVAFVGRRVKLSVQVHDPEYHERAEQSSRGGRDEWPIDESG